mgnify:CR=1 FL=1
MAADVADLVAVGYMDPGNWATSLAGGSKFGYALLFVALLIAATATLLTQRWLGARLSGAAAAATPVTVEVLVAARALDTGSMIGPGALEWAHWPVTLHRLLASGSRVRQFRPHFFLPSKKWES